MRFVLGLLLLGCSESRGVDDFDSGPAPVDGASSDAPSSDVGDVDVSALPDAGAQDAASMIRNDTGDILDGAPDTGPTPCMQFCQRNYFCVKGETLGDCAELCSDIQDIVVNPTCDRLEDQLYRCADDLSCQEVGDAYEDGGACTLALREFFDGCGPLP